MFSARSYLRSCLALTLVYGLTWHAAADEAVFFDSVAGSWKGPGEIVAGKYKGTKFTCDLAGDQMNPEETGIVMDGTCRIGVFSQKMTATVTQDGQVLSGQFLDGAGGKGLDIVAGNISSSRAVLAINRKTLTGAMIAQLTDPETMNVTVSVHVGETLVPVLGMTLTRYADNIAVGSIRTN